MTLKRLKRLLNDFVTEGPTDQRTDGRTDQPKSGLQKPADQHTKK